MQQQLTPNTVFFRGSSTTEDSDPSGWVLAYSPDGRLVEREFGLFPTKEQAEEKLRGYVEAAAPANPDRWRATEVEVYDHLAALGEAEKERDLAIAHDRQPYPTAEAYEKACAARTKWQQRAEAAQELLDELRARVEAEVERLRDEAADRRDEAVRRKHVVTAELALGEGVAIDRRADRLEALLNPLSQRSGNERSRVA